MLGTNIAAHLALAVGSRAHTTMASSARVANSLDGTSGGGNGNGKEPELKRRKLLDAGGPIEDDETARQKMRDALVYERGVSGTPGEFVGFDSDNLSDVKSYSPHRLGSEVKPMGYFAVEGDLPMMRWLYVNGADTRDEDVAKYFPMLLAAFGGQIEACKWLLDHGAARDIKRSVEGGDDDGHTPLSVTFGKRTVYKSQVRDVSRWLILSGVLCNDGTSDLDIGLMKHSLGQTDFDDDSAKERPKLLKWAREHHQSRSSFDLFLMGTLSTVTYSVTKLRESLLARIRSEDVVDRLMGNTPPDQYPLLWTGLFPHRDCPLAVFAGTSGILELIGEYVGIMRGREARIVRQLTELLPGVIAELAVEQAESDTTAVATAMRAKIATAMTTATS